MLDYKKSGEEPIAWITRGGKHIPIFEKDDSVTQLSPADIRAQIKKLQEIKIMVSDTPVFDTISKAIKELEQIHNKKTGWKKY